MSKCQARDDIQTSTLFRSFPFLKNFRRAGTLANILGNRYLRASGQPAGDTSFIVPASNIALVPDKSFFPPRQ